MLAARADGCTSDVASDRQGKSGKRDAGIVSPKASLTLTPTATTELYLSGRLGFHSNDARGTTIRINPSTGDSAPRVDSLVRSRSAELGVRRTPVSGLRTTLTAWLLNLDSELLFTGDAGITEPSAASS